MRLEETQPSRGECVRYSQVASSQINLLADSLITGFPKVAKHLPRAERRELFPAHHLSVHKNLG